MLAGSVWQQRVLGLVATLVEESTSTRTPTQWWRRSDFAKAGVKRR